MYVFAIKKPCTAIFYIPVIMGNTLIFEKCAFFPFWAQLFEGQLVLTQGLVLIRVSLSFV